MSDWLRNFDRISFWLGFLAASLFWFLAGRLISAYNHWRIRNAEQRLEQRRGKEINDEIRLGNDTLRAVQRLHLGASMFSLDEVIIPPRLLAPTVPPELYEPPPSQDITDFSIPYTPDFPELLSFYNAPSLSPEEALAGGANLVITGQPGSGKTVTLAYLATRLIGGDGRTESTGGLSPVLVHAGDILANAASPAPLDALLAAVSTQITSIPTRNLPEVLQGLLTNGRLALLLDGLDELAFEQFQPIVQWLEQLLELYPRMRVVAAASPDHLGRLPALGFQPIPLATWGPAQRLMLISRWSDLWNRHIAPKLPGPPAADPLLVVGWLLNATARLTPLELTLKIWAALAGDSLGPGPLAAVESYVRRVLAEGPPKNRLALEQLAAQAVLSGRSVMDRRQAESWLGGGEAPLDESPQTVEMAASSSPDAERVRASGAFPDLVASGLLVARLGEHVSLLHPALLGYLAAGRLSSLQRGAALLAASDWSGRSAALGYMAVMEADADWPAEYYLESEGDLLHQRLLNTGRWLRFAPHHLPWVAPTLRRLAGLLQNDDTPRALKARILSILVQSGNPGIPVLLRQMTGAPSAALRSLAALGMGMVHDPKGSPELLLLLDDRNVEIFTAAILALVAVGEKEGLEAVAALLVSGNEGRSRAAAEALANHAEEGHPTLEEAAGVEDPNVRRAAAFGLGRVNQPWAKRILEKLRSEDTQWTVQDAARQMLEGGGTAQLRLPRPLPAPTHLPWLLAFAADRGMGIAPGKPAQEMLVRVLREGSPEQIEAAVYYLQTRGDDSFVLPLYRYYFGRREESRDNVYEALRQLAAMGVPLPPPSQYDLR